MSIFEHAIDDIFNVPDFQEYMRINNRDIAVISYQGNTDTNYTQFGIDNGKQIQVTCKVKDYSPARGDKVIFRRGKYKVDNFSTDSHNLCHTITLKSLESV